MENCQRDDVIFIPKRYNWNKERKKREKKEGKKGRREGGHSCICI